MTRPNCRKWKDKGRRSADTSILNLTESRFQFIFRTAERTFTTAERIFTTAERTFRSAEHKPDRASKEIRTGYMKTFRQPSGKHSLTEKASESIMKYDGQ